MESADDVLEFWFGESGTAPDARADLWWGKVDDQEAVDRDLDDRFGELVGAGLDGELEEWREAPETCVAYVVTLDQFPRHIHRGSPRAFAGDERALAAARLAWDRDYHDELSVPRQLFVSMPMMHAEDVDVQHLAVEVFEWIAEHAPSETRGMAEGSVEHAREHCEIVERFGRFPHRNPVLDRTFTDEEWSYLEETGKWYGQKPADEEASTGESSEQGSDEHP